MLIYLSTFLWRILVDWCSLSFFSWETECPTHNHCETYRMEQEFDICSLWCVVHPLGCLLLRGKNEACSPDRPGPSSCLHSPQLCLWVQGSYAKKPQPSYLREVHRLLISCVEHNSQISIWSMEWLFLSLSDPQRSEPFEDLITNLFLCVCGEVRKMHFCLKCLVKDHRRPSRYYCWRRPRTFQIQHLGSERSSR